MWAAGYVQGISSEQHNLVIHRFPEGFVFEDPGYFTDPFRYIPHPLVRLAASEIIARIDADPELQTAFSEGKMLGVLVCEDSRGGLCYIAAFSGNVNGQSWIEGFVPPIYDLAAPDGHFKKREAEISEINRQIEDLMASDRKMCLEKELADAVRMRDMELDAMKESMADAKRRRTEVRAQCSDPEILDGLIRESQHEKAGLRRLKQALNASVDAIMERIALFNDRIESLKKQRASMSEELQDWIFRQYIVHNASGEEATIAEIFAKAGCTPPGGTGECAAPKLLEYAWSHDLEPLAMGEFWYGKSPDTAVRTHGHFYPSCTSKCGPLLGFMLKGMKIMDEDSHPSAPVLIHEDKDIIVVEKPGGMPSVPGLDGKESLQEWIDTYLSSGEDDIRCHSVHRLDMDTSGVMIFAKTSAAAVNIRKQFEEHSVRKTYMAKVLLSREIMTKGVIELPLSPDYDERPRQKADFRQGKPAYTAYETVQVNSDGTADLLLYPATGRTHQLRVHCAHSLGLGSPIAGDLLYGSHTACSGSEYRRLCLHALGITLVHPSTGETITFSSRELCY